MGEVESRQAVSRLYRLTCLGASAWLHRPASRLNYERRFAFFFFSFTPLPSNQAQIARRACSLSEMPSRSLISFRPAAKSGAITKVKRRRFGGGTICNYIAVYR